MEKPKIKLLPGLQTYVQNLDMDSIPVERKRILKELIDFGKHQISEGKKIQLNFICTHNSRRSQFSQIWAETAAAFFGINASCYSGGVEVTEFNPRAVASLKRSGFEINFKGNKNPKYDVQYAPGHPPLEMFSKIYDDPVNPEKDFAAIMTCSHADENCPFIPGATRRIALNYEDPKAYDGTAIEAEKYDERSGQIATELFYVFSEIQ